MRIPEAVVTKIASGVTRGISGQLCVSASDTKRILALLSGLISSVAGTTNIPGMFEKKTLTNDRGTVFAIRPALMVQTKAMEHEEIVEVGPDAVEAYNALEGQGRAG